MTVLHLSKRMAAAGVATALTVGALVAVAPVAHAAPVSSTYTCVTPLGPFDIPVSLDATGLPEAMLAGEGFDAGLVDGAFVFTAPGALAAALQGLGLSALTTEGFDLLVGDSTIPVGNVAMTGLPTPGEAGSLSLAAAGTSGVFAAPTSGVHDVVMPQAFTLVATVTSGTLSVPCTTAAPSKAGTVTVTKNASTTSARPAVTPFRKGKAAKMKVTVSAPNHAPSGRVLIKEGSKTLGKGTLAAGRVVVNLGSRLAVGTHKVVVSYPGDGYTTASRKTVTFKVAR